MTDKKNPFRLIHGGGAAASVAPQYGSPRELLRRVLKAKLTPTLTVEEASHLNIPDLEEGLPSMEKFLADFNMLRSAGLDIRIQLDDLPEGIVITDPDRFKARFPDLAPAVPVMMAHEGVQPYTDGIPRRLQATRAAPRPSMLRVV